VWHGKTWAGDSKKAGITRAQDSETIVCSDPKFDDYVAVTYADLRELREIMLQCKDWGNVQEAMPVEKLLELNRFLEQGLNRDGRR
jgi:hypothetical protein